MIPTAATVTLTLLLVAVTAAGIPKADVAATNPLARFDGPGRARPSKNPLPRHLLGGKPDAKFMSAISKATPAVVNWVTAGGVTPVADQGQCGGGCVAYTVTGNVEGVNFATNGRLVPLSAQEVVSCAMPDGCCGGFPSDAEQWFIRNTHGKICTASSFPYNSSNGSPPPCTTQCTPGAQITQVISLPTNEDTMASVLAQTGPIAVAVDATSWEFYTGGVMTNCSFASLDHTAVAVGYNNNHNPPYWLIKNSWGTTWGESGYIRIAKGTNQCGVNGMATTVRVRKD